MSFFYQVAVNFPKINSVLTYKSDTSYEVGSLVEVPLGRRNSEGLLLGLASPSEVQNIDENKIKEIIGKVEGSYNLTQAELEIYDWMSKYYHYPIGKLVFDCLPKILKRPRKADFVQGQNKEFPHALNPFQRNAFEGINQKLFEGFSQHYLHGVTGSGKSLVYLNLIKKVIESGKSAQFLLPEINLTPQFIGLFEEFLNCPILSYHSGVTPSEKNQIWKTLKEESRPVLVMGVRSSIFLPIDNLGLVIVDEEHDQSFKQTDRCPYNGRDVAIKKAQVFKVPVVLGSATPSLENFYLFKNEVAGRKYYALPERAGEGKLPKLILSDTRDRFSEDDPTWPLLPSSIEMIRARLEKGEQVLVFINKLGFSNFLQCRHCGHQFKNENCGCDNNLRFFKKRNYLSCAHCDFKMQVPDSCPECGSLSLMNKGFGTEKVQEVLQKIFPEYVTERFDRDEILTLKDLNTKLTNFHEKKIDILVGTQMLSKGHNFERVNLVVILGLDQMLNYADFRSSERTYQLAEQVIGRAGRYGDDGEVVIQTLSVDHPIFKYLMEHSFSEFYDEELKLREMCFCPPYSKMAMVYFSSRFRDRLIDNITQEASKLRFSLPEHFPSVRLLGPTPMSIEKKANQFTWAFMLKSDNINELHRAVKTFEGNLQNQTGISIKIDVDPLHIL